MKREGFGGVLYRMFRKDIGRKAMALLCALILWVYLDSLLEINKQYRCPILVISDRDLINSANENGFFFVIPEDLMELKTRFDQPLTVYVSGPTEQVPEDILIGQKEIYKSDMEPDLAKKKTVRFAVEQFVKLKDKENLVVRFEPEEIELDLALLWQEPVVLSEENIEEYRGLDALRKTGREIYEVLFNPNSLKIEGPAPEVLNIREDNTYLKLEGIRLEGVLTNPMFFNVGLSKAMRDRSISIIDNELVKVTVRLSDKMDEYFMKGMEVTVKYRGETLTEEDRKKIELESDLEDPEKVNVRIIGPSYEIEELKKMSPETLRSKLSFYINLGDDPGSTAAESFDDYLKRTGKAPYTINIRADWPEFDTVILRILPEPDAISVKYIEPQDSK